MRRLFLATSCLVPLLVTGAAQAGVWTISSPTISSGFQVIDCWTGPGACRGTGDGWDESTLWTVDFRGDPDWSSFNSNVTRIVQANQTVRRTNLVTNADNHFGAFLPDSRSRTNAQLVNYGDMNGGTQTITRDLKGSVDHGPRLLAHLRGGTPGLVAGWYWNDAIISLAQSSWTGTDGPQVNLPSSVSLGGLGGGSAGVLVQNTAVNAGGWGNLGYGLTLRNVTLGGANPGAFRLNSNPSGSVISASGQLTIDVEHIGGGLGGSDSATLFIETDAGTYLGGSGTTFQVQLTGNGFAPVGELTTPSLDAGLALVGYDRNVTVAIDNSGNGNDTAEVLGSIAGVDGRRLNDLWYRL